MPPLDALRAPDLRAVMVLFLESVKRHQEELNRLNVFPVPDNDTGTNMMLTLDHVAHDLADAPSDLVSTARAIAHGALMGGRGNSGVILSGLLRGFASAVPDEAIRAADLAAALCAGADASYEAVMKHFPGTMVSVARGTADAARTAAELGGSLEDVATAAFEAAQLALEATTDELPALREAGVVDAGSAGFVLFVEAIATVVGGSPLNERRPLDANHP